MKEKLTKEYCIQKYKEYKEINKKTPLFREYIKFAEIPKRQLLVIYGEDSYSKLQEECGDNPNKRNMGDMKRTPLEVIMRQYGGLLLELKMLPTSSVWEYRKLTPTVAGLYKAPHFIKWSDLPGKFKNWVDENNVNGYEEVLKLINSDMKIQKEKRDKDFERIISDIKAWSPARGRNTEETYKVELRNFLEKNKYEVQEESGDSNCDLLINKEYFVEIKKNPSLGEYDRLFGQLARHLQNKSNVIALIMDVPKEDHFKNFCTLVDKYLNKDSNFVEVLKK